MGKLESKWQRYPVVPVSRNSEGLVHMPKPPESSWRYDFQDLAAHHPSTGKCIAASSLSKDETRYRKVCEVLSSSVPGAANQGRPPQNARLDAGFPSGVEDSNGLPPPSAGKFQ